MRKRESVLIIGGGVIGLSIAWELSGRGFSVTVVDENRLGKKASWAGAGILSPANHLTMTQPLDRLMGYGSLLHESWAAQLRAQTGIENGFRRCGGIYIARTNGESAALRGLMLNWQQYQIEFEVINDRTRIQPVDTSGWGDREMAVRVPAEAQICNPDHLKALIAACRKNRVTLVENCPAIRLEAAPARISGVFVDRKPIKVDLVFVCAGAWSAELLKQLDLELPLVPVRGQMLLYKLPNPLFESIINEGSRYIVPRSDGHVLVGSTTEEAGFDETTTAEKLNELRGFAKILVPDLTVARLVNSWAGLRPASHDGFPYMGRIPGFGNAFLATGHFKAGLQMSTATAVLMADLVENRSSPIDISPFDPARLAR